MIDKKTILKIGRKSSFTFAVAALSCGATYFLCNKMYEGQISNLKEQVDVLKKKELQSRVTQRVSEQMEEIASQQTLISNKERDRAEAQKRIADIERGKAEIEKGKAEKERGLAMEAQRKALASADEAKKAQKIAEQQTKIATDNMIIAENARNQADTLMYLSLANSLAQSSTQVQQSDYTLARLLSYSSWYYSQKYKGNVANQSNIYESLLDLSGSKMVHNCDLKGTIRRFHIVDDAVIAFTDYGEVYYSKGKERTHARLGNYDFRDFVTGGKANNTVLSVDGNIFHIDLTNLSSSAENSGLTFKSVLQLPKDLWYRLICINGGKTLVAMGEHTVTWINAKTFEIQESKTFDAPLSTIGIQGDILHIFCKDGKSHYVSDTPGVIAPLNLTSIDDIVTAYLYDETRGYQILGMNKGLICILDKNGQTLTELPGHTAAITDLHTWKELLGATSNDASMMLWNIDDLSTSQTPVKVSTTNRPLVFDIDKDSEIVWIANGGLFEQFCSNVEHNAAAVQNFLDREFTNEEWNHYIGKGIEKVKFMKK